MKFKQDLNEKRGSIRIAFRIPVEIFCPETEISLKGILVNLSINGMLLELNHDNIPIEVEKRKICTARLTFQGKSSKLIIDELQFSLSRSENNMLALKFSEPLEWFLLFTVYKNKQLNS